ncbi:MAG: DUF362 domain-containing protein [Asgard group archaeon]|nr:DUF362 domain-containing protein [Asgard group archaeon]
MTKVALVKTNNRREGVKKLLKILDINPVKEKHVVLKPNFNTADPPPASTHMNTLEQLIIELENMGAKKITLAERSGPVNTEESFQTKGVYELSKKLGFEIVNLDKQPRDEYVLIEPDDSHWKKGFLFSKLYKEAEAIVETGCIKTHRFGGHFTLSLKNAVGLVPREGYSYMNELHSSNYQREMIAEINTAFEPDLIIMDGVDIFIDGGPDKGTKKNAKIMIAGTDRIAVDAVCVAILRLYDTTPEVSEGKIFEQDQIARAVELGLGVSDPSEIILVTDKTASEKLEQKILEKLIS